MMLLGWRIFAKRPACPARRSGISLVVALAIGLQTSRRSRAEDHADYKYEDYMEESRRIHVETDSILFEADLLPWLTTRGNLVYDAISGATPNGAPPQLFPETYLARMQDIRRAGYLESDLRFGRETFTPQISYSRESDYESIGLSLGYALDFNEKNTTLNLAVAHDFDHVIFTPNMPLIDPSLDGSRAHKNSTELLAGVRQLLGAGTVLTANASFGVESGDLNDPYRGVFFGDLQPNPQPGDLPSLFPEVRPRHRLKEIAYLSLTQFATPLNGSIETSYRFYHDSYGIFANTLSLAWFQKLGGHLVLSPSFRFYEQTAASFYYTSVPNDPGFGDPQFPGPNFPTYYSSDYRLSSFNSYTYGFSVTWKLNQHVNLDAAYERYDMRGADGVTSTLLYPKANVLFFVARLWPWIRNQFFKG